MSNSLNINALIQQQEMMYWESRQNWVCLNIHNLKNTLCCFHPHFPHRLVEAVPLSNMEKMKERIRNQGFPCTWWFGFKVHITEQSSKWEIWCLRWRKEHCFLHFYMINLCLKPTSNMWSQQISTSDHLTQFYQTVSVFGLHRAIQLVAPQVLSVKMTHICCWGVDTSAVEGQR